MSLIDRIGERDWKPFSRGAGEEVEVTETVFPPDLVFIAGQFYWLCFLTRFGNRAIYSLI